MEVKYRIFEPHKSEHKLGHMEIDCDEEGWYWQKVGGDKNRAKNKKELMDNLMQLYRIDSWVTSNGNTGNGLRSLLAIVRKL